MAVFSAKPAEKKDVIVGVQKLLNVNGHYARLKEDGIVGRETRNSYGNAPERFQDLLDSYAVSRGFVLKDLMAPKSISAPNSPPRSEIVEAISKYCTLFGVSEKLATTVAWTESKFDPTVVNASGAAGLFQITRWAISQVQQSYSKQYFPQPQGGRTDLAFNCMVGIGYLHWCAKWAGVNPLSDSPSDWAKVYGAYNLGPEAFRLWQQGAHSSDTVTKAWSNQAAFLKKGGVSKYLDNVRDYLSSSEVA